MPGQRHDERGSTHVLEGVIVAIIMVSAATFVVTFDAPTPPSDGARVDLRQKGEDALDIMYDTPLASSSLGENQLSAALLQCLQQDCTLLETRLDNLLPDGAFYSVHISNGYGSFPVLERRTPGGEAAASSRLVEPAWSFSFLAPALDAVNPAEDPLVLYGVPVFNSNAIHAKGSALRVTVTGTRLGDNSTYTLKAAASTLAAPASAAHAMPAASLTFVDAAGAPIATQDFTPLTINALGVPTNASVSLRLRLNETGGVPVPTGTRVAVHVPQGWTAVANSTVNPAWHVTSNATGGGDGTDLTIAAELRRDIRSEAVDLHIDAVYRGDALDHHLWKATLSRGAGATASMLARSDRHDANPVFEVPRVALSVPRPMGSNATTTWTLGVVIPETEGAALSDKVRIESVRIEEESGAAIFGGVTPLAGPGGTWTNEGDALVWNGSHLAGRDAPLSIALHVQGSGVGGPQADDAAFVPTVALDGWNGRMLDELAPGLYRGVFLPQSGARGGYNGSTSGQLAAEHDAVSTSVWRSTALPGSAAYVAAHVLGLEDSTYGTDVSVANRTVPVGSTATIDVDVQSLLYQLGPLGYNPTVRLKVHPPWAQGNGTPIEEATLLDVTTLQTAGGLLSLIDTDGDGRPEKTTVGRFTHEAAVPPNWLFGPYLVEVEVTWGEDVSALVDGLPLVGTLQRSARVYDYFVVTPPDALAPASPVYNVHLVTWMGDWG